MMQVKIEIRKETETDFSEVYEINTMAFGQDNEARLVGLLRHSSAFIPGLSLVAAIDYKVIGHILFTKINIQNDEGNIYHSLALAPIAVLPQYQKRQVGSQLISYGLIKAKELGHKSVIVLGHEHYYPKFGFVAAEKWKIKAPFDVPVNVFMGIELVKDGLNGVTGTVQYPKEFQMV